MLSEIKRHCALTNRIHAEYGLRPPAERPGKFAHQDARMEEKWQRPGRVPRMRRDPESISGLVYSPFGNSGGLGMGRAPSPQNYHKINSFNNEGEMSLFRRE